MSVRYVRVNPVSQLITAAQRGTGNVAVVGITTASTAVLNVPIPFATGADAISQVPGDLGQAISLAFEQTPGPGAVFGVPVKSMVKADLQPGLDAAGLLDVQFVVLANTPVNATSAAADAAIDLLAHHITDISKSADGKERMGVAMLDKDTVKDVTNIGKLNTILTGNLISERMVYVAHRSDQDAAAAVAGVIAGYPPHVSMVLKPVSIKTSLFTSTEIDALNGGTEDFTTGPNGKPGVNWLTSTPLLGTGVFLGEGYTGDTSGPKGKKFIDIVRTMDDISFRLKARLISSIGSLRISRSGLRALITQIDAELTPLQAREVIDRFTVEVPLLRLLDKNPTALTDAEAQQIKDAHANRIVEITVAVDYAGAIHRLAITLVFK